MTSRFLFARRSPRWSPAKATPPKLRPMPVSFGALCLVEQSGGDRSGARLRLRSRGRWCDRVDGICKAGECGYDEDCEEGFACDTENNVCRPPCDLGGGIGCECTVDASVRRPALLGRKLSERRDAECSRDDNGTYSTRIVRRTELRGRAPVQVVQCTPVDMGTDCVTDSDCAGSACNGETGRCETLACMRPTCARDGDCPSVSAVIRRRTPASKT